MRRTVTSIAALGIGLGILAPLSSGALIVSNVQVSGSLSAGVSTMVGTDTIDIVFGGGGATVGDSTNPIRGGNLIITFDVDSTSGNLTQDIASITGSVSGSGFVVFNEIIEDRTPGNQGVIGSADLLLNGPNPNPATIMFSRGSSSIKVKKTLVFSASPSELLDNATVTLLRQTIVPSPGSVALLGIGSMGLLGRRRRS